MHLQWDKLFINNEVFVFSEETGSVELETEIHCNVSSKLKLAVRKEKLQNDFIFNLPLLEALCQNSWFAFQDLVMGESLSIFHVLK